MTRTRHRTLWLSAALALWLCAPVALAADGGRAAQLFDEAQTLVRAGDFAAACARLEESQRLDPQLGTQLHLANCYEKRGQTASAYLNFRAAAELAAQRNAAGQDEPREAVARRRATALEARLSTLRLHVEQPDTPGLRIQHDGRVLERARWGEELPVDPGSHQLLASAAGRRAFSQNYTLSGERARAQLTVPSLSPLTAAEVAAPSAPSSGSNSRPAAGIDGQRLAGLIVAGAGVVGLGAGSVFGLLRNAKVSDIEDACGEPCNIREDQTMTLQHVRALRREANGYATAATLGFVVGGAALLSGIVLLLTAPSRDDQRDVAMRIEVGPSGISVRGRIDAL